MTLLMELAIDSVIYKDVGLSHEPATTEKSGRARRGCHTLVRPIINRADRAVSCARLLVTCLR